VFAVTIHIAYSLSLLIHVTIH